MRNERGAYTYAGVLSEGLFHPVPTVAFGAAVKVGTANVFRVPVAVYVGKRDI